MQPACFLQFSPFIENRPTDFWRFLKVFSLLTVLVFSKPNIIKLPWKCNRREAKGLIILSVIVSVTLYCGNTTYPSLLLILCVCVCVGECFVTLSMYVWLICLSFHYVCVIVCVFGVTVWAGRGGVLPLGKGAPVSSMAGESERWRGYGYI